jgi:hypothetical protein
LKDQGFDLALSVTEDCLDEALDRAARDPDSAEAREEVAEFQWLRTNLLRPNSDIQPRGLLIDDLDDLPRPRYLN